MLARAARREGFTLVELAIVLVIIGMLVGGILVAQSMIETAKITNTIRQLQQYEAAVNLFQTNYGCLPGDCAKNLGLGSAMPPFVGCNTTSTSNACNVGDGDGKIADAAGNVFEYPLFSMEARNFWWHLVASGMLPAYPMQIVNPPDMNYAFGGMVTPVPPIVKQNTDYAGYKSGGWFVMGVDGVNNQNLPYAVQCQNALGISLGNYGPPTHGVITNAQAAAIDAKLDDGQPLTGKVTATGPTLGNSPSDPTASVNCLTGSNYNVSYTGYEYNCGVLICTDF